MTLLSISNIAWSVEHDEEMYDFLHTSRFSGIEIAPTRIFPEKPYEHLSEAETFATELYRQHGLSISSMQSLWYGRTENLFGSPEEFSLLLNYTKQAVDFASAMGCGNLVFGAPKNRNVPPESSDPQGIALKFFREAGDYAAKMNTIISIEANPKLYGTNFINTTAEAFSFVNETCSDGIKVNIDIGTMIYHKEPVSLVEENRALVNHIHMSEPNLLPLEHRNIHRQILRLDYNKYFSIEISNQGDLGLVKRQVEYVSELVK
jgi:sugar phosphate isomerase/epimerase